MDATQVHGLTSQELRAICSAGRTPPSLSGDVTRHLVVPPRAIRVEVAHDLSETVWVVLDEKPEDEERGYLVVYSSDRSKFGLAVKGRGEACSTMIGFYGSLLATFATM